MSEDQASPQAGGSVLRKVIGLALIAAVVVVAVYFATQPGGPDLHRVVELRNLGIAWVENTNLEKAEGAFEELTKLVPNERLGWQNLAIARLLQLESERIKSNDERFPALLQKARQAVDHVLARYPDDADSHILLARWHGYEKVQLLGEAERQAVDAAHNALTKALELRSDDPATLHAIAENRNLIRDPKPKRESVDALKQAAELLPRNLHLMNLLLAQQASRDLVKGEQDLRDPELEQTLKKVEVLAGHFCDRIYKQTENDVRAMVADALQALKDRNLNLASGLASGIGNILRREIASMNDAKEVDPHLLEFLIHDFSDELAKDGLPKPGFPEAIPVSLKQSAESIAVANPVQIRLADIDLDDQLDLAAASGSRLSFFRRDAEAKTWGEVAGIDLPGQLRGFALLDLDRDAIKAKRRTLLVANQDEEAAQSYDADLDAIAFGDEGIFVIRNDLNEESRTVTLNCVESETGLEGLRDVLAVLPIDFDHDGDLDLIVSTTSGVSLWLNHGQFQFADFSQYSDLPPTDAGITQMIAVDWDRNVSLDVLCFGDGTAGYLSNILHGRLRWQAFGGESGIAENVAAAALIDSDANFSWDLLTAGDKGGSLARTSNPEAGVSKFIESASIDTLPLAGLQTWDFDNDGFQDLLGWDGSDVRVWRGGPMSQFKTSAELSISAPSEILNADIDDIDSDGDLDVVFGHADTVSIFLNEGGNANHWFRLPVRGEDDDDPQRVNQRVNIHGTGSLIEVSTGSSYQPLLVTRQATHIGLGKNDHPDSLRVIWTNGIPEHIVQPESGATICLQQALKGSCPYIYTWDGEQFSFYTDCLWAAPVGLQLADGVLAPCRPWEYLKIEGDRLREKDGEYQLLLTEELWEIGYFEQVRLLAVDHPEDIAIYSNEKVGPPSIAEFGIHTVRESRTPVSAVDQKGRNVLPTIAERDDDYLKAFDVQFKQGLTEPHYIELDLGDLAGARKVTLFLTGWIRPTDTSLNIAISQRPDLESTQPPSIHVPDQNGEWQQVRPFIGFPGGKTKTIAVDLSGVFLTDDFRVRVATSMEIYWDQVFFKVDEEPAETRVTEMPLLGGTLEFRGFSKRTLHPEFGPERYDGSNISTVPHWPPMEGRVTAYGDVTELIRKSDDRMVALGAGDSMHVRFTALNREVPAGWKRDFILHCVGWDKDADLNTIYGQAVDPLPRVEMTDYLAPRGDDEPRPFADQRRKQDRASFWRLMFDERRYRLRP